MTRGCSSRPCSRSSGSSSGRTGWSSGCSSRCSPAATACSKACPASPRRWPSHPRHRRRRHLRPHPVHPRPGALRHRRHPDLPGLDGELRRRARPGLRQLRARRRDQPGAGQGAVRAARGDGRAAGHHRRADATRCPNPFLVLATQNPIESEGVYQLPEAQRDRFLMKVVVDYPSDADELAIVLPDERATRPAPRRVLDPSRLRACRRRADRRLRPPRGGRVRGAAGPGHPRPGALRAAGDRPAARLRGEPPGHPRPGRRRPGAGAAARARRTCCPPTSANLAVDVLAHRLVLSFDALADGRRSAESRSVAPAGPRRCRRRCSPAGQPGSDERPTLAARVRSPRERAPAPAGPALADLAPEATCCAASN